MKLHYYLSLLIVPLLFACKPKEIKNMEAMELNLRNFFNDYAFKENADIKIYELKFIKYDTVNENSLDTQRILKANELYSHYNSLYELHSSRAKLKLQQGKLYAMIGSKTLVDIQVEDAKEDFAKAKSYVDSMGKYAHIDSVIRKRIVERKKPEVYYLAKVFMKASIKIDTSSSNMLDTVQYYFDRNLKYIELSKLNLN